MLLFFSEYFSDIKPKYQLMYGASLVSWCIFFYRIIHCYSFVYGKSSVRLFLFFSSLHFLSDFVLVRFPPTNRLSVIIPQLRTTSFQIKSALSPLPHTWAHRRLWLASDWVESLPAGLGRLCVCLKKYFLTFSTYVILFLLNSRFRMKCHLCVNYIEMQTDPATCDYVIVSGASRKEERWNMTENEQILTTGTAHTQTPCIRRCF